VLRFIVDVEAVANHLKHWVIYSRPEIRTQDLPYTRQVIEAYLSLILCKRFLSLFSILITKQQPVPVWPFMFFWQLHSFTYYFLLCW